MQRRKAKRHNRVIGGQPLRRTRAHQQRIRARVPRQPHGQVAQQHIRRGLLGFTRFRHIGRFRTQFKLNQSVRPDERVAVWRGFDSADLPLFQRQFQRHRLGVFGQGHVFDEDFRVSRRWERLPLAVHRPAELPVDRQ